MPVVNHTSEGFAPIAHSKGIKHERATRNRFKQLLALVDSTATALPALLRHYGAASVETADGRAMSRCDPPNAGESIVEQRQRGRLKKGMQLACSHQTRRRESELRSDLIRPFVRFPATYSATETERLRLFRSKTMSEISYCCPHCGHTIVIECTAGDTAPLSSCPFCECQLFEPAPAPPEPDNSYEWEPSFLSQRRRPGASTTLAYILIFCGGIGLAFVAGVAVYRSGGANTFPADAVTTAKEKPQVKASIKPNQRQLPPAKPQKHPRPTRQWVLEARGQYLAAGKAHNKRVDKFKSFRGTPLEIRKVGEAVLFLAHGDLDKVTPEMIYYLRLALPEIAGVLEQDAAVASLQKQGLKIDWYDREKRKALYTEYQQHLGTKQQMGKFGWPPDMDLSPSNIDAALAVSIKVESEGFESLNAQERQLLLDAGSLDFFDSTLTAIAEQLVK